MRIRIGTRPGEDEGLAESALVFSTHKQCAALLETVRSGRAHLPKFGRSRRLEAGSVVYDFDDPVHHLYLVNSGQVRASVLSAEGRELVTGIYGPGEMFGQFCLCQRRERNERAVVTEDAELVSLGVEDLLELAASPDGALAMLQ